MNRWEKLTMFFLAVTSLVQTINIRMLNKEQEEQRKKLAKIEDHIGLNGF